MNEIKTAIIEQLQELQLLMNRSIFQSFFRGFKDKNPHHNPHRGQGRVLAILKLKPEITQRDLTYMLGMSKQATAEILSKLEKAEYIARKPSDEDKRVMMVSLTEKGKNVAENLNEESVEAEAVLNYLDEEELNNLNNYLGRIIKAYEEQFPNENFEDRRRSLEGFLQHHKYHHGHSHNHDRPFGGFGRQRGSSGKIKDKGAGFGRQPGEGDEIFGGQPGKEAFYHADFGCKRQCKVCKPGCPRRFKNSGLI